MNLDKSIRTLGVFSDAIGERGALSRGGVHGQRRAVFCRNGGGCVCLACRWHYPTGSALGAMTLADATNAYRDRWRGPQRLMDAAEADHPSVVVEPRWVYAGF
jgi:hypothetical protein